MIANLFRRLIDHGYSDLLFRAVTALPLSLQKRLGLRPIRVRACR